MTRLEVLVDPATGDLLVEDGDALPAEVERLLGALQGPSRSVACAAPPRILTLAPATAAEQVAGPTLRLAGYWHDSLIEGPGRRSVAKLQGCPIRCAGCLTPDSWDTQAGTRVSVERLADVLLDPSFERDGVTILGGEPFAQPDGLLALVQALRSRGCPHLLVYSGYTHAALRRRATPEPAVAGVLAAIDMLIDGPYVAAFATRAGPWTGSGNQRVIDLAATRRGGRVVVQGYRDEPAVTASDPGNTDPGRSRLHHLPMIEWAALDSLAGRRPASVASFHNRIVVL
jgi:anaerobic ribonucleoside-triphosphate reductase activating protein